MKKPLTVAELIEKLKTMPPQMPVVIYVGETEDCGYPEQVKVIDDEEENIYCKGEQPEVGTGFVVIQSDGFWPQPT